MSETTSIAGEPRPKKLEDYVDIMRRRWLLALQVFGVLLVGAAVASVLWPATYRSAATILIEQQEIPQDLVRSTITSFADQRIELISARVMTTDNLLAIIREHGLYADIFDREPREVIIELMRGDVVRRMISAEVVDPRSGRPTEATIAFTVGFESRSPQQAVRVANALTTLYLEENSVTRREQAADTTTFFTQEAERLNAEIVALEAEFAQFKQDNVNTLPELTQLNMQLFDRTEVEIAAVQRDINLLEERKIYLESELAQLSPNRELVDSNGAVILSPRDRLKAMQAQLAAMRGLYGDTHPAVTRTERSIAALEAELGIAGGSELDSLRDALAQATAERGRLLESLPSLHPEVVRVDRRIEALEAEIGAVTRNAEEIASSAPTIDEDADNPAYVQLSAQLTATTMEIAALTEKQGELDVRLDGLEQRLTQAPVVERDYNAFTRDLENLYARYQETRYNARSAETAEILELDAKGERFTLIEPALLPQQPISPNRKLLFVLGVLGSLAAAVAAVAVRESLDSSIKSPGELEMLISLAPLGVIPRIVTQDDRRRKIRRHVRYACGAVAGLALLILLAHFLYMPIDDLWFRALRRLGV